MVRLLPNKKPKTTAEYRKRGQLTTKAGELFKIRIILSHIKKGFIMQRVPTRFVAAPVKIIRNTSASSTSHQWSKIVEVKTNKVLHTGQVGYIKRVARKKYNLDATM